MWSVIFAGLMHTSATSLPPAPIHGGYCFQQAAQTYGVNADVLRAIAWHESHFLPWIVHHNRDGSTDYGIMQINSRNLALLGLNERTVLPPCANIMAGARLYRRAIQRYGNTWNAVGAYHSTTPPLQREYADQIKRIFRRIDRVHAWFTRVCGYFTALVSSSSRSPSAIPAAKLQDF